MDEDDHRRAEEEMNALSLRHLQHLQDSQKFVNRMTSMLYKALAIGIVLGLFSLLPPQLPSFVGHVRHAVFARTWDVVNVLLVAFAISYGVLGRGGRQEIDVQIDGNATTDFLDYESVNRHRQHRYSNVVDNSESEVVESSNLDEHDFAYEYPIAVAAPPMRGMRNSVSYQDLSAAGRASDSNPRRAMDDTDWVRRSRRGSEDSKANGFRDSGPISMGFGDSAQKSNGCEDSAVGLEDCAAKSTGYEAAPHSEDRHSAKKPEVKPQDFDFSAQSKNNVITEEDWIHPLPPPPPPPSIASLQRNSNPAPPPPQSDTNPAPPPPQSDSNPAPAPPQSDSKPAHPPPQKDLNPAPYRYEKRKRRPPSPPPPPPPRPPHVLETHFPKQRTRVTPDSNPHHSYEKPGKPKKSNKIKSDKRDPMNPIPMPPIPPPPPPPPPPTEILKHESRHRRSRSKDDSKQRSNEHKHSRSAKEIANAFGLLPQSERKQKNTSIPSPPSPPPVPSTLQQWFSSYKRESKHKNKDSEPSPRHRSEKSRRKVHSSSSPPPQPPPPPPPPPPSAPIYTIDPIYHKKRGSKKNDAPKPPIYSTDSNYQRNVMASEKNDKLKHPIHSPDPQFQRDETSEKNDTPRKSSGKRDSSEYRKENVNGDGKAGEKLPEMKSSIPLPPPPPPPFPMVEHHWSFYDDPILQKRKGYPPADSGEFEHVPEPEPERGWAFVFRKQFSLDNADSQFCPSPSPDEVNQKADAFIARMHQQLRLQKSISFRERPR